MTNELGHDAWLLKFRWLMPLMLLPLAMLAAQQAHPAGSHIGRSLRDGWEILCLVLAFGGLAIRVVAVGFDEKELSRRADDGSPSTGMYSIVRYPLYLGTYVSLLGLSLLPGAIWFVVATSAVFLLWYGAVVRQTEFASARNQGDRRSAAKAPMLVPNPFLWRRPRGSFSLRRVLRREQNDCYFVVAGFVGLELACDLLGEDLPFRQWLREDLHWALLLAIGTLLYVAVRPRGEAVAGAYVERGRAPAAAIGPVTRGIRVDNRVRSVDILENLISVGQLHRILDATLDAAMLSSGDRLLDIGCGSGRLAIEAASRAGIEALGIDATPGMVALARENARKARSRASFKVGVGEALPVPDATIDAVTSSYFLHHLPSDVKRQALREMWRALAPGGRLVVTDYGRPTSLIGWIAAIPMHFNFHEHVRGQLGGELEAIIQQEAFGPIERLHSFLGYINVIRIVKPSL